MIRCLEVFWGSLGIELSSFAVFGGSRAGGSGRLEGGSSVAPSGVSKETRFKSVFLVTP